MSIDKKRFVASRRRAVRVHSKCRSQGVPRLSVFKSNRHIYLQLIDDKSGRTMLHFSTLIKSLRERFQSRLNADVIEQFSDFVKDNIPDKYKKMKVVFDKGAHSYCGNIALLANRLRECFDF